MKRILCAGVLFFVLSSVLHADRQVALTIYNQDFGVVKDIRQFEITKNTDTIILSDVAAKIIPSSVQVTNPSNPNFIVREQNFQYNLVNSAKLLGEMIDRKISILTTTGKSFEGNLLSAEGSVITLQDSGSVKLLNRNDQFAQIKIPELPADLFLKPALVWKIAGADSPSQTLEIAYQTGGFAWNADYNVLLKPAEKKLDLNGWVTIANQTGTSFTDAKLKLVAGEIHKVKEEKIHYDMARSAGLGVELAKAAEAPAGFEERSFAEYHLYDLGRKTSLANNEMKQIELFNLHDIAFTTEYVFSELQDPYTWRRRRYSRPTPDGSQTNPLKVVATIENKKENQLGIPIPAGNVRMYQADRAGLDHLVGQDKVEHTPKDEKLRFTLGDAFDVLGTRKIVSDQRISEDVFTQQIHIRIRNHKADAITVVVREKLLGWTNWNIEQTNLEYQKTDYQTIEFKFQLAPNAEQEIHYLVKYSRYNW